MSRNFGLNKFSAFVLLLVTASACAEEATRGMVLKDAPIGAASPAKYGKQWALIIGINEYQDSAIPKLKNAESDAKGLYDLLIAHYGYERDTGIKLLCGDEAARDRIRTQLGEDFLGQAEEGDSVLVFFAGHGDVLKDASGKDFGVIYPADVSGKPDPTKALRLHEDIVRLLGDVKARHKLLILDSCHSGAVFDHPDTIVSPADNRQAAALFKIPAFQAVASCRKPQTVTDGRGSHSPFTESLLNALRLLPNYDEQPSFSLTSLFAFMEKDLSARLPGEQSPKPGRLTNDDGEFRFFPDRETNFTQYLGQAVDHKLLCALIPGEYATWWFDEVPWMMPSLRMAIISQAEAQRAASLDVVSKTHLWDYAQQAKSLLEGKDDDLVRLQLKHLEVLHNLPKAKESQGLLLEMVADLCCFPEPPDGIEVVSATVEACLQKVRDHQSKLQATDVHLLAILLHHLGLQVEAEHAYEAALRAYEDEREVAKKGGNRALQALCHADFGYFELLVRVNGLNAAKHFRKAWALFGTVAPPPFQVFLLCQEADAWQRLGQWGEADKRLKMAVNIVQGMGTESSLKAHVFSRQGWAYMERWEFLKATAAFEESDQILAPSTGEEHPDPSAMLALCHNLHGLAMARRFLGDPAGAAENYRTLLNEHLSKLSRMLRTNTELTDVAADFRNRVTMRWLNTMERLADCNLFADPDQRDLSEGIDDLRRALRYCHALPFNRRKEQQVSLLYKTALALSLKSSLQDGSLAEAYCQEASELLGRPDSTQAKPLDFYRQLTPAIVALFQASDARGTLETKRTALKSLRTAIEELREQWRANDNRDHLELLMFATKILIEEGIEADRFETAMDTEMLISFCHRALRNKNVEALRYLRPYYDTVMAAKLRLHPKHVKELLEIQFEATRGEGFRKPARAVPVMALYVLNDQSYLFVDIPQGVSKYYPLDEDYSRSRIETAIWQSSEPLELPREVQQALRRIPRSMATEERRLVECWWRDPLLDPAARNHTVRDTSPQLTDDSRPLLHVVLRPVSDGNPLTPRLPFKFPDGIDPIEAVPAAQPAAAQTPPSLPVAVPTPPADPSALAPKKAKAARTKRH